MATIYGIMFHDRCDHVKSINMITFSLSIGNILDMHCWIRLFMYRIRNAKWQPQSILCSISRGTHHSQISK